MKKSIFFALGMSFILLACGQKSVIKNTVKAQTLASAYGDGRHIIRNLTFPLSDSALAYSTPLPGIGPIVGGILKFVGNVFAANTNMGKLQMTYTQPIPELPEELSSVRLKRVFFYMKPQGSRKRFKDLFSRIIMGKGHVTFDFLDKLAVKFGAIEIENQSDYTPTFETKDYDKIEMKELMEIFSPYYQPTVIDPERAKELVLLRFSESARERDTTLSKYGKIFILETPHAQETKHFFMDDPRFDDLLKRILILDDSILIELQKDSLAEENFKVLLSDVAEELDEKFKVSFIDTCTEDSCLELKVPDVNLIPIATKGNALKLDAVIHAGKVPESFKLKGFVEFEVKVKTPRGV